MDPAPKRPVPVFPLPGTVLFPGAVLPLHIFELRYRTMVRDALSAERMIAIATLAPGWQQDYQGSPPFHPLGCIARIEEVEWLPNDHYRLVVRGTWRVRFDRTVREFPYRACAVEVLLDAPYTEDDPLIGMVRTELLEQRNRLAPLGPEVWSAPPTVKPGASFREVVGGIASALRVSEAERLAWLAEESMVDRAQRMLEVLRRMGPTAAPPGPPSPPQPDWN
jgi:uncharacterized protein